MTHFVLARLTTVAVLISGCGASNSASGDGGNGDSDVAGPSKVIAISTSGKITPSSDDKPQPIGTTFTFDGWSATLIKAEFSA